MTERRRLIAPGELLCIDPSAVHGGPQAFFWLFGPPVFKNERVGNVEVVRVNGPLEYHDDGYGDSYESLICRIGLAFEGQIERERWGMSDEDHAAAVEARGGPPKAVVLRIDSPGGVVAGLEQSTTKIRQMRDEAGIPLIAYADETCYSAAYAVSCACDQIVLPKSGMVGSIGVISTMVDQTGMDRKAGLRFVVLASGDEKADGHPHVPITDAMIARERPRIEKLAMQFFKDVKRARGLPIKAIQGFQARRFLGSEAQNAGVADAVMSWDSLMGILNDPSYVDEAKRTISIARPQKQLAAKATTDSVPKEPSMDLKLEAAIKEVKTAMVSEKDPTKLVALAQRRATFEAYKKETHQVEKHTKEEGDDEEDEDEEEESKGDETDRGDDADDDKDDDDDDDDDDKASSEESEEEAAKSAVSTIVRASGMQKGLARKTFREAVAGALQSYASRSTAAAEVYKAARELTGKKSPGAVVSALRGLAQGAKDLKDRVGAIETERKNDRRKALIDAAKAAGRVTPAEAKVLRKEPLSYVQKYLDMRPSALVTTHADPNVDPIPPVSGGILPPDLQATLDSAIAAAKSAGVTLKAEDIVNGARTRKPATPEV
jgi:ClpP class serine protease